MIFALAAAATLVAAAKPAQQSSSSSAPSLAVVLHVAPPASDDASLAAADVALRAPEEIGEPLRALAGHARGHLTFAIDPAYLAALDRAASGDTALTSAAKGASALSGARAGTLLEILARHRPLDAATTRSRAGARYLTLATAAANASNGDRSVAFSPQDLAGFAAADASVVLAETGTRTLASATSDVNAVRALAAADKAVADELRSDVASGSVEIAALPDGEPVLPLIVDAGGKSPSDARIVDLGAGSDAGRMTSDALHAAAAFARPPAGVGVGFYSPYGAYDDAVGPIVKEAGAAYALFTDRVVEGEAGTGSESIIAQSEAAAMRAYALTVDKGVTLPILFWNEDGSARVQTAIGASTAMADQLAQVAAEGAARAHGSNAILVLRIESEGAWSQRSDARDVVTRFVDEIASGDAGPSTTPGQFIHAHPPTASAYGYAPAAESGTLGLWMGTPDQASLWRALAAARTAAGGDTAMAKPNVRPLLVQAESGTWFSSLGDPMSGAKRLARFRAIIADIYRAVGQRPPDPIAPVKTQPGEPAPTPSPSPPPSASPGSTAPPLASPKPTASP